MLYCRNTSGLMHGTMILTCYPCGNVAFFDTYEPHISLNSTDVMLLLFPFTILKVLHYTSVTLLTFNIAEPFAGICMQYTGFLIYLISLWLCNQQCILKQKKKPRSENLASARYHPNSAWDARCPHVQCTSLCLCMRLGVTLYWKRCKFSSA